MGKHDKRKKANKINLLEMILSALIQLIVGILLIVIDRLTN